MDLYAENILDHYRHPRHAGDLAEPAVTHGEENVSCGDTIDLSLKIENGMVTDVGWHGTGCAISQAAMSLLSEELIGKAIADVESLTPKHIYDLLGVEIGPRRVKCALLCLHALKNAIRKSRGEEPVSWVHTVAVEE